VLPVLIVIIVAIGIGSAGYAASQGDRFGSVVLVLLGLLWLRVNSPVEGFILITLAPGRGITAADLFSLACFGMAVYGWTQSRRSDARK
jgi:hypothetical protein